MVLIEGIAFPLDVKNKNGWGIPSTEADNAIQSLLSSVIRIGKRDEPHGVDIDEDPNAEIGRVVEAWKDGNYIRAKANITDSIANRKIEDGTWSNGWSVYSNASTVNDGWATGIHAKSLTLVNNPAWDSAQWSVAASDSDLHSLRFYQPIKILSAGITVTDPIPNEPQVGGGIPAEYELKLSEKDKLIETLTTEKTSLSEQITALTSELDGLKTVAASRVPMDEVQKMVTTEAQKIAASEVTKYKEELAMSAAMQKLTAARKERGLDTKAEEYAALTASAVEKLADDFSKITLSASQTPQYPATSDVKYQPRMGVFDPVKGYGGN